MTDYAFKDMHTLALNMASQLNAFASQVKDQSDRVDYLKEQLAIHKAVAQAALYETEKEKTKRATVLAQLRQVVAQHTSETSTKSASETVVDNESAALSESTDAEQHATTPPTVVDNESAQVQQQATADATPDLDQAPVNPVDLQADQKTESNIQKARKTLFAVSKPAHVRSVAWDVNMVQANKPLKTMKADFIRHIVANQMFKLRVGTNVWTSVESKRREPYPGNPNATYWLENLDFPLCYAKFMSIELVSCPCCPASSFKADVTLEKFPDGTIETSNDDATIRYWDYNGTRYIFQKHLAGRGIYVDGPGVFHEPHTYVDGATTVHVDVQQHTVNSS